MTLPLSQDLPVLTNALSLARLCQISYDQPLNLTGLVDDYQVFESEGGGFAARIGTQGILVFRGTQTIDDIVIDIRATVSQIPTGYVHTGFYQTMSKRLPAYTKALNLVSGRGQIERLWFTGHSLGGALATLVAETIRPPNPAIYTFGSPRVFDRSAAAAFNKLLPAHHRFVNLMDPVPKIPIIAGIHLFEHCGQKVALPRSWVKYLWQGCHCWKSLWARLRYDYEAALAVDINCHHIAQYVENLTDVGRHSRL